MLFAYPVLYRYTKRNIIVADNIQLLSVYCRKKKRFMSMVDIQPIIMTDQEIEECLYMFDKGLYVFKEYSYL